MKNQSLSLILCSVLLLLICPNITLAQTSYHSTQTLNSESYTEYLVSINDSTIILSANNPADKYPKNTETYTITKETKMTDENNKPLTVKDFKKGDWVTVFINTSQPQIVLTIKKASESKMLQGIF